MDNLGALRVPRGDLRGCVERDGVCRGSMRSRDEWAVSLRARGARDGRSSGANEGATASSPVVGADQTLAVDLPR